MARARTLTLNTKVNVTGADKLRGLGDQLQNTGKKMTVGLTLPILGIGAAMANAAIEAEKSQAKLESTFESMGAAAWTTVDALNETGASLQQMTTFGDEEIRDLQGVLLTFGNVTGEAFDKATVAALDMSAALGTDTQAAAIQLGKALNDPIKGVSALSRVGVSFTEQQKDMIRTLVEAGDVMGAQNIILGEMERQFGGTAEALAQTAGGKMQQAMNALGDAAESFGAVILPVLADAAQAVKGFAEWLQSLDEDTRRTVVMMGAFVAALGPVLFIVGTLVKAFVGLKGAFLGLKAGGAVVIGLAPKLGLAFTAMTGPIGIVIAAVGALVAAFATDFLGIRTHVMNALGGIGDFLADVGDNIRGFFGIVDEEIVEARRGFSELTGAEQQAVMDSASHWEEMQGIYSVGAEATAQAVRNNAASMRAAAEDGLSQPLIEALLGGKAEAERIAGETPGAIAQALIDNQFSVENAAASLQQAAEDALHPLIERAQIIAFLASDELQEGLRSGIPAVAQRARELKEAAEGRLSELSGSAWAYGNSAGTSFADGMNAAYGYVVTAAGNLAAAARNQIGINSEPKDRRSPLYGITKWGQNIAKTLAEGMNAGANTVRGAAAVLAGAAAVAPVGAALTPSLAGARLSPSGDVHYHSHFELHIEGETPSSRDDDSIRRLLQRMATNWGG